MTFRRRKPVTAEDRMNQMTEIVVGCLLGIGAICVALLIALHELVLKPWLTSLF